MQADGNKRRSFQESAGFFRMLNKAKSKQTDQACLIIIYHHIIGQMAPHGCVKGDSGGGME